MDSLQLVMVAGLVLLAMVNAGSLVWAMYLDRKLRARPVPKNYDVHVEGTKIFSDVDMAQVQQRADAQLEQAVQQAAHHLQQSVEQGVQQLAGHINDIAANSLNKEFEKYQLSLEDLRQETMQQFSGLQKELAERRSQLFQQIDSEAAAEREKRMQAFNNRINDVVASYIAETLGNRVDLGAQTPYILESLQKRKDDIKRDILA